MSDVTPRTPNPFAAAIPRWDINQDGTVTCEEWQTYATRLFTLADKNRDGYLDATEFRKIGTLEPIFADAELSYFDEDHDGRVSRREFVTRPNQLFTRYDVNRDCRVTVDEIQNEGRSKAPAPPRGGGSRPGPGTGRGGF